MSIKTWSTILT